jgi:hypothetical protein
VFLVLLVILVLNLLLLLFPDTATGKPTPHKTLATLNHPELL